MNTVVLPLAISADQRAPPLLTETSTCTVSSANGMLKLSCTTSAPTVNEIGAVRILRGKVQAAKPTAIKTITTTATATEDTPLLLSPNRTLPGTGSDPGMINVDWSSVSL